MDAIRDLSLRIVGAVSGDVLYDTQGQVCAFIRGREVFTFGRRHIGIYDRGLFRTAQGEIVGTRVAMTAPTPRRRRFQITSWLSFSIPAPRPEMTFRTWAIWDRALEARMPPNNRVFTVTP